MRWVVVIKCDAASHAPKKAIIGRLQWEPDVNDESKTSVRRGPIALIEDEPVDQAVFGSRRHRPDVEAILEWEKAGRSRHDWLCDLCGFKLDLRHEKAVALAGRLASSDLDWQRRTFAPKDAPDSPMIWMSTSLTVSELAAKLE